MYQLVLTQRDNDTMKKRTQFPDFGDAVVASLDALFGGGGEDYVAATIYSVCDSCLAADADSALAIICPDLKFMDAVTAALKEFCR